MTNPFTPSFGVSPPVLVGRDQVLAQFDEAIDDGPGAAGRATLLTGPRGSGKTVMLNAIEDAAKARGWVVISETTSRGLVTRIARQHLPRLLRQFDPDSVIRRLSGVTGPFGSGGVTWSSVQAHVADAGLRNQLELLTDLLSEGETGVLITLDEIHHRDPDDLREVATTVQHAFRERREIALVGAGLASAVSDVLNDDVLTFLRRAERHALGPVADVDMRRAIREPIEISGRRVGDEALDVMVDGARGYPFLIQLVGARTWRLHPSHEVISTADAAQGVREARERLASLVYQPALAATSEVDRSFLRAMADDDGPSSMADIGRRLHATPGYASQYRARLIAADLIVSTGRGRVDFALPYFRDYLRTGGDHT